MGSECCALYRENLPSISAVVRGRDSIRQVAYTSDGNESDGENTDDDGVGHEKQLGDE